MPINSVLMKMATIALIVFLNGMNIATGVVAGESDQLAVKLTEQLSKLSKITSYSLRWQIDYFEDGESLRLDNYAVESTGNYMRIEYKSSSMVDGKRIVNQKWLRTFNDSTAMTLDLADKILLTASRKSANVPGFITAMPPFTLMLLPTLYQDMKTTDGLFVATTCLDLQQLVTPTALTRAFSSGVFSLNDKRLLLTKRVARTLPEVMAKDITKQMFSTYKSNFSFSGEFLDFTFATSLATAPDVYVAEEVWKPKKTKRLTIQDSDIVVPIEYDVTSGMLFTGDKEMTKSRYRVVIDSLEIGEKFDDDRFEIDPVYADTIYDLDSNKFIKKKK